MMVKLMVRQGLIGMIMPIFYNLDLSNFEHYLVERLKNVNQLNPTKLQIIYFHCATTFYSSTVVISQWC